MTNRQSITQALGLIFQGIEILRAQFGRKDFTIDGRLVGDLGEVIASLEYDLDLYSSQRETHDGETSDGRKVQVKATFKDSLTMTKVPELYLGLQLLRDGSHSEVFNGPGSVIAKEFSHRKGIGEKQLSFSVAALAKLSKTVLADQRVKKRVL